MVQDVLGKHQVENCGLGAAWEQSGLFSSWEEAVNWAEMELGYFPDS